MKLHESISQSAKWVNASNDLVDGIDIKSEDRYKIAASLFHLAMEHHGSIHLLIINKHYGSAFALLRPQLEAFIRGAWFHHCAKEEHIEEYKSDKEPPRINQLIGDIEATSGYEENTLKQMKKNAWSTLCGYTHGGYYQVSHRNTPTEIISDYNETYICKLINQSSSITLLTLAAIASLINNEKLANKALLQYDSIFDVQQE